MVMSDDHVAALIQEIAVKHGIAVDPQDPIMILHTVNARLLEDSAKGQAALLAQFKTELDSLARVWEDEAKKKTERIIHASLAASRAVMHQQMEAGAKTATASVHAEMTVALVSIDRAIRSAQRIAYVNTIVALLTVMAAVLVYLVGH